MFRDMVTLRGKKYRTRPLRVSDVKRDALVRFEGGATSRRVIGHDGTDVILRGVLSKDVLEAVDKNTLLEQWVLMVPAGEAS